MAGDSKPSSRKSRTGKQERDLERARETQGALLPKEIAQVAGFEVVAAWEATRLVGGDYYDVIRPSDAQLGICSADVVGKAVSAALLMANVEATVRARGRSLCLRHDTGLR